MAAVEVAKVSAQVFSLNAAFHNPAVIAGNVKPIKILTQAHISFPSRSNV